MIQETRENLLRNIHLMDADLYADLLRSKTQEEKMEMFNAVDRIVASLQNVQASDGLGTYNSIRDNRKTAYGYFYDIALSMRIEDYAFLKTLEIAIAFENQALANIDYEAYAELRGIDPEIAKCYEVTLIAKHAAFAKKRKTK